MDKGELLDFLANSLGCAYLSDLRQLGNRKVLCSLLTALAAERFTAEQWQEASAYLSEEPLTGVTTAKELQQLLIRSLNTESI
ncbi:MAG: hypothetical protein RR135_00690 [Oscillospiraceae bacterium]